MPELVPSYPQPYRLFNPLTGHPLFSGPNGQPGYSSPQPQSDSWVQPDGVRAWFYDTSTPDPDNRVALGLDVSSPNDPGIGYTGAYEAAGRHGANPTQADLFAAIAMAESSAHWSDHNNTAATGDDSIGLWQINLRAHPQFRAENLYNIDNNADAARQVSGNWTDATPWSTFKSGAYKQFLRGGGPPVGQVTGPPPPAPAQVGPVRSVVDALIGQLPDPSIFGYHPRDSLQSLADGLANAADAALSLIEAGLAPVRQWVADAVSHVETIVDPLINAARSDLTKAIDFGVGAVEGIAREAGTVASEALNEAEAIGGRVLADAEGFARTVADDAIGLAERGIAEAESLASAGVSALAHLTSSLITDAEHLAEAGIRDAEDLAAAGVRDAESIAAGLAHDAEATAEAVLRPLIADAEGALSALERDVIAPLVNEADHWFRDLLGPLEPVLSALLQLGQWVLEAAQIAFLGPFDIERVINDLEVDDVLSLFEHP